MINGPLFLRLSDGKESMKDMNGGPVYHVQRCSGIGSFKPIPSCPETGINVRSFAGLNPSLRRYGSILSLNNPIINLIFNKINKLVTLDL